MARSWILALALLAVCLCDGPALSRQAAGRSGGTLAIELRMPKPWRRLLIGPARATPYPNRPRQISLFMTGDPTNAVKVYLHLADSAGREHCVMLSMFTTPLADGKVLTVPLRDAPATSHSTEGAFPLATVKPPVKLKGLSFVCRKPLGDTILYVDTIRFDGVVVEDFEGDRGWRVLAKEDESLACTPRIVGERIPGRGMEGLVIREPFPDRQGSLTTNGNFETDADRDRLPDGWAAARHTPLVPRDRHGKPMFDPARHAGTVAVASIGAESLHSVAVGVTDPKAWAAVATVLKDVKSNTDYTISFWYRQPKPGDTKLVVFGERLPMQNQLALNPEHWCRYSGIFSSGRFSGDCVLALGVVRPAEPTTIHVDRVNVYEGVSPIGYNRARLEHPYYGFAEISPDVVSYVPFHYECLFARKSRPREIRYVLELPAGVAVNASAGWYMRRWGTWFTWRTQAPYRTARTPVTRDGKPYVRHSVILPAWQAGDERSLVNYVVPVGVRDGWRGCLGSYCAQTNLGFALTTTLSSGTHRAFYYAAWRGGRQQPQELALRVVRVPKVTRAPKRMVCMVSANDVFGRGQFPDMIKVLRHVGANGVSGGSRKDWGPGMRYYATWANFPTYRASDRSVAPVDRAGGRRAGSSGRCMSYRGPVWKQGMGRLFRKIDQGCNVFLFDDAKPATCYCDRCKAEFARMLQRHSRLPYVDPTTFMAPGWSGPAEYKSLWHDFQLWVYGVAAQAMKEELIAHAKKSNADATVHFLQSAFPCRPKHPFAYATVQRAFDFQGLQMYLYCYHAAYQGSPKQIGVRLQALQEQAQGYANPAVPTLSPGLGYMHPVCSLDPHAQMTYQILEAAMAHKALGYNIYAGSDIDLGDLRSIAEANRILGRFEDLFVDGTVVKGATVSGTNASVRLKQLGKHILLLVADYSTYQPRRTLMEVTLPKRLADRFTDVETGQTVVPSGKHGRALRLWLSKRRARLFYGGPGWTRD